jgi:hypothetical protein
MGSNGEQDWISTISALKIHAGAELAGRFNSLLIF